MLLLMQVLSVPLQQVLSHVHDQICLHRGEQLTETPLM